VAKEIVWRGRTPRGFPFTVEREGNPTRWVVTVLGAVRCRDCVLSTALGNAVALAPTSLWVRHVASLILERTDGLSRSSGAQPLGESATP
jgi:hypothetical protein